ncbi:MAG: alpha/beta hydrolase [Gammaproteobacteria bacterium]|nr:alpha/beta hydrolase [Gammaproteobacteria bacterium]
MYLFRGSILRNFLGLILLIFSHQAVATNAQSEQLIALYRPNHIDQTVYLPTSKALIHYQLTGEADKPVVVLLHGVNASYDTYNGWMALGLANHYRVLRIDMPPFGLSSYDEPQTAQIQNTGLLLNELLDKLDIKTPVTVVGNSYGGYVAWEFAAEFPQRTNKVVLIDASGYQKSAPFIIDIATNPLLAFGYKLMSPCFVVNYFHRSTYGDGKNQRDPKTIQRYCDFNGVRSNRKAIAAFYHKNSDWQITSFKNKYRPTEVKAPTLILWGRKDTLIDPHDALRFHQDIAQSQVIYYDKLGHVPMEEDPAATLKDVLSFMDK